MRKLGFVLAVSAFALSACGPQESGGGSPTITETLDVEGSCLDTQAGICLNYISFPTGGTAESFRTTCENDGDTWSTAACSRQDVYGQCTVSSMGGKVVTYFKPPALQGDATATCSQQGGSYKTM